MNLLIKCGKEELQKNYLYIINGINKLSPKEIDVLSEAMKIDSEFGDKVKRHIRSLFNMSSQDIAVYVQRFKNKRVLLVDKQGVLIINPKLYIKPENNSININIKIDGVD